MICIIIFLKKAPTIYNKPFTTKTMLTKSLTTMIFMQKSSLSNSKNVL